MTTRPSPAQPAGTVAPAAQSAGRGLLFITVAKLWFMVGAGVLGLGLQWAFPRSVSAQRYGEWATVLSAVSVLNNVVVTGTIQAVSKFASRGPEWVEGTKRTALSINLALAAVLVLAYLAGAPLIADWLKDPGVVSPLRVVAGVVGFYALYAVFVGAANGARLFHKQAGLDMTFTTLRAGLVIGAAALFSTVTAASAGFTAAAATIFVLSVVVVGWGPVGERPRASELLTFAAPVAAYLLVQNLLLFVDLWVVKGYVAIHALDSGATGEAAAVIANKAIGAYNGGLQIARLPYQLTIAVTFVIFPLVSQATFVDDAGKSRDYVRKSIRLSLIVVAAAVAAVAAGPVRIFELLFPATAQGVNEYLPGAAALTPLMVAYASFSLFSIAGTILNAAGATTTALLIGLGTLLLDVALNVVAVKGALGTSGQPLAAAAVATALSMTAGLAASLVALQRRFGASLALVSAARITVAAAAAVVVTRYLPLPGGGGLVGRLVGCALPLAIGAVLYVLALFATRELTVGEVRSLLRRGK